MNWLSLKYIFMKVYKKMFHVPTCRSHKHEKAIILGKVGVIISAMVGSIFFMTDKDDEDLKRIANIYTDFGDEADVVDAETMIFCRMNQHQTT